VIAALRPGGPEVFRFIVNSAGQLGYGDRQATPTSAATGAMVKMVFMLNRCSSMSRVDFIQYFESHHPRLGEKYVPNAVRYIRRFLRTATKW
jgi:hypothetical protein